MSRRLTIAWTIAAVAAMTAATACGGKSNPMTPSPAVSSIAVSSSSDLLFIGASDTFTATATLSNGTTQAITTGAWGSDERQTVSVDVATGRVTAIGSGNAVIFVDFQGVRGSKTIRALPNFQGGWIGSYIVQSCSESGEITKNGLCGNLFTAGQPLPMSLLASQTRDAVTTQLSLGTASGSGSGPVELNGDWLLVGTVRNGDLSIASTWVLRSAQPGKITGSGNLVVTNAGLSGDVRVTVGVSDLSRTSTAALQ